MTDSQNRVPEPPDQPSKVHLRLVAMGLYFVVSLALFFVLSPLLADKEGLENQIEGAGTIGLIIYVLLYILQIVIPWLPGVPIDIIGGAIYGFWEAVLISSVTAAFSGVLVMLLVRRVGLEVIVARFPGLLERPWRLVRIISMRRWTIIPINMLTGDVAYFISGAANLPIWFAVAVIGGLRVPSVMVGVAIGAGIISPVVSQQFDVIVTGASLLTIIGLIIGYSIAQRFLPDWLEKLESIAETEETQPEPEPDADTVDTVDTVD